MTNDDLRVVGVRETPLSIDEFSARGRKAAEDCRSPACGTLARWSRVLIPNFNHGLAIADCRFFNQSLVTSSPTVNGATSSFSIHPSAFGLGRVFKMLGVRRRGIWVGNEAERSEHPRSGL
jgi:hypothetical protein